MTRTLLFLIAIFTILFMAARGQSKSALGQLHQLSGTWAMGTGDKIIYENWQVLRDGSMTGKSYKIKGADSIIFEQMKFVEKNKQVFFLAKVTNQNEGKEVPFKLISSSNHTFVFENPEHDFPQRVIYQIISKDSVHAWIEGKYKGKDEKEEFYYSRQN